MIGRVRWNRPGDEAGLIKTLLVFHDQAAVNRQTVPLGGERACCGSCAAHSLRVVTTLLHASHFPLFFAGLECPPRALLTLNGLPRGSLEHAHQVPRHLTPGVIVLGKKNVDKASRYSLSRQATPTNGKLPQQMDASTRLAPSMTCESRANECVRCSCEREHAAGGGGGGADRREIPSRPSFSLEDVRRRPPGARSPR